MSNTNALAIIGGTGLYDLPGIEITDEHLVETPFGDPSGAIIEAKINDLPVFFLPRHGASHALLPHEINYRANIFALKSLGATVCLSICASGSLKEEYKPGDFVLIDQLIDFTMRRDISFFGKGLCAYTSIANPVDSELSKKLYEPLKEFASGDLHRSGTYLCIEGPQLSTKAESVMFQSWGAGIIGMTACPEAHLAAEAQLSFLLVAMVTDYDCWKEGEEDVSAEGVIEMAKRTSSEVHKSLPKMIAAIQESGRSERCSKSLQGALMCDPATAPHQEILQVLLR